MVITLNGWLLLFGGGHFFIISANDVFNLIKVV